MRSTLVAAALGAASLSVSAAALGQTAAPAPPQPLHDAPDAAPAPPPPPPAAPPAHGVDLTTLEKLRDRGILSESEYDAAVGDISGSTGGKHASDATSLVFGRWVTTLYGVLEGDTIYDSTQSFTDVAGNAQVL